MEYFLKSSRRTHGVAHNGEMEKRKQQMVNSTKKVNICKNSSRVLSLNVKPFLSSELQKVQPEISVSILSTGTFYDSLFSSVIKDQLKFVEIDFNHR